MRSSRAPRSTSSSPCAPAIAWAGHVVQGHVDGTGDIRHARGGSFGLLELEIEPELARYLVEKGSVAIDGVSLTVSACVKTASQFR